jgi:hypothetical protein
VDLVNQEQEINFLDQRDEMEVFYTFSRCAGGKHEYFDVLLLLLPLFDRTWSILISSLFVVKITNFIQTIDQKQ